MVDEFTVVCVDRAVASSATAHFLQESSRSSPASSNHGNETEKMQEKQCLYNGNGGLAVSDGKGGIFKGGFEVKSAARGSNLRECRICQEEEDEKRMEAPCACSGTLKFAHRKCIQRWCNKKGDITCEICSQVFAPNYTRPPPRSNADVMTIDIRQAWGHHVDIRDPRFLAFTAAERRFLESEYDEYTITSNGTIACFRSIAIMLMLLLLMRQTLMISKDFGVFQESSAFFHYQISVLQLAGFLLPCYVVARSLYIAQCRRRNQG